MTVQELIATASQPMERLRWLVLKEFEILPYSESAKTVTDDDILKMAAHMVLDARQGVWEGQNPTFSVEKFTEVQSREK